MPWANNIAKTMKSKGRQFTVTREMLTAVACDQRWRDVVAGISAVRFLKLAFVLFWIESQCQTKFTVPLGSSHCVNYYISVNEPNPALWLATRAWKMELSCPLGTTRCAYQEKIPGKLYNKSFIYQACSVKMAGYWPSTFLRVCGSRLRFGQ